MLSLYNLKINVRKTVYEPAEDTFLLIKALEKIDLAAKSILEIGIGSGLIALVLAKKAKKVIAADINPEALECAKENAKLNGIKNVEFIESDLFSKISGKFDLIVFNPPYLPDEPLSSDIALDGGKNGREVIDRFVKAAPKFLNKNGSIFLVESSLSQYQKTLEFFNKAGFKAEIAARERFDWEELAVIRAENHEVY